MKIKFLTSIVLAALALCACDDNTDSIGSFVTDNTDHLNVSSGIFAVSTRSVVADSVLSRSSVGYLGKVKDPETGAYITGDFIAQFSILEGYSFPAKDSIASRQNGEIVADSCEIILAYSTFFGDSLATMKLTAQEMNTPLQEGVNYYSNFDPAQSGLIRANGVNINKVYTLKDMSINDKSISIGLNEPYTDKNGNSYNNYGTYILQSYYNNPSFFKNPYSFIHNVVPGFYFKNTGGLGSMANIDASQIVVYLRYQYNDSIYNGVLSFAGTEEVLQKTTITNDQNKIKELAADNSCTYLKTPAGIFTELTLPVDDIMLNHENDTINSAKIVLTRINNSQQDEYALGTPSTLLLLPADSLYSFFENSCIADNKQTFLTTYTQTKAYADANTYTFGNISTLITQMAQARDAGLKTDADWVTKHPNWNRVMIVPVVATYTQDNLKTLYKVTHDMSLTSTRLYNDSVNIYVIYSKFK